MSKRRFKLSKNVITEKENEKLHIHTTISKEIKTIIDDYATKLDENGDKIFGNKAKVIEKAIELLDAYYNPNKKDAITIWNRARGKNMVLVAKTTFLAYISGKIENAYTDNLAVESVEWYLGKKIEAMTFEEFLYGLKGMWHAANYFYQIDLETLDKGTFHLDFYHDQNKKYSTFWVNYFETIIRSEWSCLIDSKARSRSFKMIIREVNKN